MDCICLFVEEQSENYFPHIRIFVLWKFLVTLDIKEYSELDGMISDMI